MATCTVHPYPKHLIGSNSKHLIYVVSSPTVRSFVLLIALGFLSIRSILWSHENRPVANCSSSLLLGHEVQFTSFRSLESFMVAERGERGMRRRLGEGESEMHRSTSMSSLGSWTLTADPAFGATYAAAAAAVPIPQEPTTPVTPTWAPDPGGAGGGGVG